MTAEKGNDGEGQGADDLAEATKPGRDLPKSSWEVSR
jgi:hypothetical protein